MADDGAGDDKAKSSGGKGALGDLAKAESMVQLALAIPVGCFVGLLLGAWLDRHFHQHWMSVAGMLLGAAGGFIQIFTSLAHLSKRDK
jgi:F0F1-type ATP synthase assembly protein I